MFLSISEVNKTFAGKTALAKVSLEVDQGEIICLLGPSGCGKTTLLRIMAGLEQADSGRLICAGEDISRVPPYQRNFGLMFQDYALFPHKNVFDNVAFGLRMPPQKARPAEIAGRVREMLSLVGLEGFAGRSVNELSGGEAQRVALARSLAPRPRLLMLDEPLGALDRALRERLMTELRPILTQVGTTAVYVTHDQAEAFAIADRVVVMRAGHIEQTATPELVYRSPASAFVANFLGMTNLAEGVVLAAGRVGSAWGELAASTGSAAPGTAGQILIRPEAARLPATGSGRLNRISGRLLERSFRGGRYHLKIQPDPGPPLTFHLSTAGPFALEAGQPLTLCLDPAGIVLIP
jgi:ABC-type Fe3+/spermidine/putrescine transport system ATPase subunit